MRESEPVIRLQQVAKVYHTGGIEFVALDGISVELTPGQFISVVGKSGSGKSTMVNMLTGIDRPTSGQVMVGATEVNALSESEMARWRGANLGIVFQFYQLLPMLTLLENVLLPMDIADSLPAEDREERAMSLLAQMGLEDVAHELPGGVSGGQQQSAAVARALANDPPILIADEPTGNLDTRAADRVFALFETLASQGKTVIVVTHDDELAARADRTIRLADGQIVGASL